MGRQSRSDIDQLAQVMIAQQSGIQKRNILATSMTNMMRFHRIQVSFHHKLQKLQLFIEENPDHQLIMDTQQNIGKEITGHTNPEKGHQILIMVIQGEGFDHQVLSLEDDFHDVHHRQVPLEVILIVVKAGTHLFNTVEIEHLVLEGDHPVLGGDHLVLEGDHLVLEGDHLVLEGDHPVLEGDHPVLEGDHPVLEGDHLVLEGDQSLLEEAIDQLVNLRKVDLKEQIKGHQELVSRGNQ